MPICNTKRRLRPRTAGATGITRSRPTRPRTMRSQALGVQKINVVLSLGIVREGNRRSIIIIWKVPKLKQFLCCLIQDDMMHIFLKERSKFRTIKKLYLGNSTNKTRCKITKKSKIFLTSFNFNGSTTDLYLAIKWLNCRIYY